MGRDSWWRWRMMATRCAPPLQDRLGDANSWMLRIEWQSTEAPPARHSEKTALSRFTGAGRTARFYSTWALVSNALSIRHNGTPDIHCALRPCST
jgi:hypothetical protein